MGRKFEICGGVDFDDPDSAVSGEAILAGRQEVVVYVPPEWTPEYVGVRLLDAYDSLRRANVGRIHPKGAAGYWPEIFQTNEDLAGWAEEHRKEVEAAMARAKARPGAVDLARMDEALAWPLRYLHDNPLLADAATLWAWTTVLDVDVKDVLHQRKKRAQAIADRIAAETNASRRAAARAAAVAFSKKLYAEWKVDQRPPHKQREALDKIQLRAEAKAVAELKRLGGIIKANPTLGMPNKVLAPSTLDRLRKDALQLMAERMRGARLPVK